MVSTVDDDEQDFSEFAAGGAFVVQTVTQKTRRNSERDTSSILSSSGGQTEF